MALTYTEMSSLRLIASDGQEFSVSKRVALLSPTIQAMIEEHHQQHSSVTEEVFFEEIRFNEVSSHVLSAVVDYFHYKLRYLDSRVPIPPFDIDPAIGLELLAVADFLQC